MPSINQIIPTNAGTRDRTIVDYFSTATTDIPSEVRNDADLSLSIQPVTINPPGSTDLYSPDFEDTDTFQYAVGLADGPATGGTFKLTVGATTTGLLTLAYNISAAALQTPLSAAFVTEGEAACTVTLLATGLYKIRGNSNGAIASNFVVADSTLLLPSGASAFITGVILGDGSNPYSMLLVIRIAPLVFAEPLTLLTAAGVTLTTTAAGSSTSNKIQKIAFDALNTYGGTYNITATVGAAKSIQSIGVANPGLVTMYEDHNIPTGATVVISGSNSTPTIDGSRVITVVSSNSFTVAVNVTGSGTVGNVVYSQTATCGVAKPGMEADELAQLLTGHPQISFNARDGTPDNVVVWRNGQDYFVEFTGALGDSSSPTLAVTNIDLVSPRGLSGTVNFNTIALNEYASTQDGDSLDLLLQVRRTRASGEYGTILGPVTITIFKDILDPTTMVPTPLPTYLTVAMGNSLYARLGADNTLTGILTLDGTAIDDNRLIIKANATQTSDLLQVKNSGGTVKLYVSAGFDLGMDGSISAGGDILANGGIGSVGNAIVNGNLSVDGTGSYITGTATNDSAAAGKIGQIVSSLVATGSAVGLTTATAANVTSISLTAGDWDVEGNVNVNLTAATQTASSAGISLTSATLPTDGSEVASGVVTTLLSAVNGITLPRKRVSIASTTTVYLVAKATFAAGTEAAFGGITARRVR